MPSVTAENYLKKIYFLSLTGAGKVSMGQLARSMEVVPGTATTMVKSLEKAGWIEYTPRIGVELTPEGTQIAQNTLQKQEIISSFLAEVLELTEKESREEAARIEHSVSDHLYQRIAEYTATPEEKNILLQK